MKYGITRREFVKSSAGILALSNLGIYDAFLKFPSSSFMIGACDWSIGQRAKVEAMSVGRQIGLDGVQISLGTRADDMHLRDKKMQEKYMKACKEHDILIGGIAIGELNHVPYKSDPQAEIWVSDSIDVANLLGVDIVLLAFFGKGDLKNDSTGTEETIQRLKKVMPKAEDKGITFGIESWLSAEEHLYILNEVNSPNLKVYYDVANSHKMGYDIYSEIRSLGKENICEFHAKENGNLLGKGLVDFQKVRQAIDDIGYTGWIQIEGAVPPNASMMDSYIHNNAFLRSMF